MMKVHSNLDGPDDLDELQLKVPFTWIVPPYLETVLTKSHARRRFNNMHAGGHFTTTHFGSCQPPISSWSKWLCLGIL